MERKGIEEIIEGLRRSRTPEDLRRTAERYLEWDELDPGMKREILEELAKMVEERDESFGIEAIRTMEGSGFQDLPRILGRIAEEAKEKGVRKEARRSLHRLRTKGLRMAEEGRDVHRKVEIAPEEREDVEAYVSPILAQYLSQFALVINMRSRRFMGVYISYISGGVIRDILVTDPLRVSRKALKELAISSADELFDRVFQVPYEYVSCLVNLSFLEMKRMGLPVPGDLYKARPDLIGYEEPERAYIYSILDPEAIRSDRMLKADLRRFGADFPYQGLITEEIASILERYRRSLEDRILSIPRWAEEDLKEKAVAEATKEIFGDERTRYGVKRAAEELAFLSYIDGEEKGARSFVAAALSLDDLAPEDNDFLKGMVESMIFRERREEGILYLPSLRDVFRLGMNM